MAGVEDEDEFKDALAAPDADPPPRSPSPSSSPKPTSNSKSKPATNGGGAGLGRRLFASIPLPATLSAAIGRFSGPKPPPSNVGLGLLLDAGPGAAPSADGPPASDVAASGGSSLHMSSSAAPQRHHGDDQVAGRGAGAGEEELGLAPAEEVWDAAEDCREKEGLAVDGSSANRNCFLTRGQEEEEGEQCPGDELGAAVAQDQEVVVEQQGPTEDCAPVVEDESNYAVEQCSGDGTLAVEYSDAVEVNERVINQECAGGILDAAEDGVSLGLQDQEENAVAEEQGVDVISVQDQHEAVEQCFGDQLTTTTDGNAAQDREVVVEQQGATEDCAAVVEDDSNYSAVELFAGDETSTVKASNAVEVNERLINQECGGGILDAAEDGVSVGLQEEENAVVEEQGVIKDGSGVELLDNNVVAVEQGEDGISLSDDDNMVEPYTSDQLRATLDDYAAENQKAVEQEGDIVERVVTTDHIAAGEDQEKEVDQSGSDESRSTTDENGLEDNENVDPEDVVNIHGVISDGSCVGQEEGVVVADQVGDAMSAGDEGNAVEQCTNDQLRKTMEDNAAEFQELVEQEGATATFENGMAAGGITVEDQDKEVEQSAGHESSIILSENAVEDNKKADQEDAIIGQSTTKEDSGLEAQVEGVVVAEQGGDAMSAGDEGNAVEQCTNDQLRATMEDNAAEFQELVEQEGATFEKGMAAGSITVEDQEKEVEQSAGDESSVIEGENAVEDNKVDKEDAINRQGTAKEDSGVEAQEEGVVVAEHGGDAMSAGDEGNAVEQYSNDQLRATMEDNAAEFQELVEQEDATFEKGMTDGGITVEDQDKEAEQSAGEESIVIEVENAVEDNKKLDHEDAINGQGTAKEDSGVEPQEENVMEPDQGFDDLSVQDEGNVVVQHISDQLRTTMEDNAAELQEAVEEEGAIFDKGMVSDGITVEDQDKEMEQSAGHESRATNAENSVDDKKVYQEDAIDKGAVKDDSGLESQEESMVVPDQGMDDLSVLDESNVEPQCTSDQLRITTDNNAAVDLEVVEQECVGSIPDAAKVGIAVEELREEDIMVAEQVEDGFVQDQDETVEQRTSDILRTITDDNDVEDQEVQRDKIGLYEGYPQRPGKLNCRFYMTTGSCSYGSSCHFNHPRLKAKLEVSSFPSDQRNHEVEFLELNRVGLPIREGARKCTYYMRNGTCRYGKKCCYNHPEQVLDVQLHTATGWDDANLQSSPHSKKSPEHRTMDNISSGSEILPPNILRMLLPPQNVPPCTEEKEMRIKKDPDWASASDDSDGCCSADSSDGPLCKQEHGDYPERPECPFLLKFGNCRFGSSCQYYHPKGKFQRTYHPEDKFQSRYHPKEKSSRYHPKKEPALSGELMVYPDRPGEPECPFYVKTGSCKFGANCKFHHPKDIAPSMQGPASPKRSFSGNEHHSASRTTLQDQMYQQQKYPERPGQPDCWYYMHFGKCKYQSECIFNHPKDILSSGWHPAECSFYMKTGTCQFGSACEFYHPKDRCSSRGGVTDGTDYGHDFATNSQNVLQQQEQAIYPERPGELECPHYMKHGYCKFQMNCKYHHPRDRIPKK